MTRSKQAWPAELALTDDQLANVMTVAADLPPDKRGVLLQRIAARLQLGNNATTFADDQVADAIKRALPGLIPETVT